jgi:hypothetical protein
MTIMTPKAFSGIPSCLPILKAFVDSADFQNHANSDGGFPDLKMLFVLVSHNKSRGAREKQHK